MENKKTGDFEELSALIRAFCKARDWDQFHSPKEVAIGVCTESAELLELFRFKTEEQIQALLTSDDGRERVGEELADILYFILRFADLQGFDLNEVLRAKMKKNELKYPVDKSRGNNLKYTEFK